MTPVLAADSPYHIPAILDPKSEVLTSHRSSHEHFDYTITWETGSPNSYYNMYTDGAIGSAEVGDLIYVCDLLPIIELVLRRDNEKLTLVAVSTHVENATRIDWHSLHDTANCLKETLSPGILEGPSIMERRRRPREDFVSEQDSFSEEDFANNESRDHGEGPSKAPKTRPEPLCVSIDRHGLLRLLQ